MNVEDPLKIRIDRIRRERWQLGQRVAAAGIELDRIQQMARGEASPESAASPDQTDVHDDWPRTLIPRSPGHHRGAMIVIVSTIAVLLVSTIAVLFVVVERRWSAVPAPAPDRVTDTTVSSPRDEKPASILSAHSPVDRAGGDDSFVIHVRAIRPSRVRVIVDGETLDWHPMQEGDEFVSRPRQEIRIESDDAGALAATINGRSIRVGGDGQTAAFHLTIEDLERFLAE